MIKFLILAFIYWNPVAAFANSESEGRPEPEGALLVKKNATELPAFLRDYLAVKNALVEDDFIAAKKSGFQMKKSLGDAGLSSEEKQDLDRILTELVTADDIGRQRLVFVVLSELLYHGLSNVDLGENVLFWQSCGMAFKGRGASWISLEEKVSNPYMGQEMPSCGKAVRKLAQ